jgi:hypothetical protein
MATIPIKGKASLSKSLFPNCSKHTCLMAKEGKKKAYSFDGTSWVLDSGCTNPMNRERRMFTSIVKNDCESDCIMFGDHILGFGKIAITAKHSISKVLLVESLDYNLLSVSQLCEMGYNCLFTDKGVTIFRRTDGSFALKGILRESSTLWISSLGK